jgi:16S rRNA C1402 (ribose-2'-O) methylase RsmI
MYLLLDIDGVMVPAKSWERPALLQDGFMKFSDSAVAVLQSVITQETVIVLTTSHRNRYSVEEWHVLLKSRGIMANSIMKLEESDNRLSRKDEIMQWFETHDIHTEFVILDDDKSLNELPAYFKKQVILTHAAVGLTAEHLMEIKSKLQVPVLG